jgi:creatinine amidohydrolase/Fe(II)-dependent formamide hydrolase-like protein
MSATAGSRRIGDLTFQEIGGKLRPSSILCLPLGSMEQHGPHLPLNTDSIIADEIAVRIVTRWAATHDTWLLPLLPIGVSPEHAWAPGTMSLSMSALAEQIRAWGREITRALPARNLVLVNGHGGNRGLLDGIVYELRDDFGLNACAMHLGVLMSPPAAQGIPEIHGGRDETSVMLALAPDLVQKSRIADLRDPPDAAVVRQRILDPGITWAWSSGEAGIADHGITGDPAAASVAYGHEIIDRLVEGAGEVLQRLLAGSGPPPARAFTV